MKKFIAMLLVMAMVLAFAACAKSAPAETTAAAAEAVTEAPAEPTAEASAAMTHEEYVAAELGAKVYVETYVQAHQSWWDGKITVYAQSEDGAYFLYEMPCSEEDAAKLEPGTKIAVTGYKAEWSGEVEIKNELTDETCGIEILEGSYIAEPADITDMLSSEDLVNYQNEKVSMHDLVVAPANDEGAAFLYNWDGSGAAGNNNDLYFNVTDGNAVYTFTVESYLCGEGTDVYTTVTGLSVGDVIDVEGFLYWYNGAQPHVTAVTVK